MNRKKHTITFKPSGTTVTVPEGITLLDAASEADIAVNSLCGGQGACGKCRVKIEKGRAKATSAGIAFLTRDEIKEGFVLACETSVNDDLTVLIPPEARLEDEQILTAEGTFTYEIPEELVCEEKSPDSSLLYLPATQKFFLNLPPPTLTDNISDLDRVYRALRKQMEMPYLDSTFTFLKGLSSRLRENNWQVTATIQPQENQCPRLLFLEPGDTSAGNYGMALDIGTTTIAAQLVDLRTGKILGTEGSHNQQSKYGVDVISRIMVASSRDGLHPLHKTVRDTVNSLSVRLCEKNSIVKEQISALCVAGNTTMIHLFLEVEPCTIRLEPYIPTANAFPSIAAHELGLFMHPQGVVTCIPGVSSYVGGDITAGVLASGISNSAAVSVLIDVGTNGEIVIGNNEWLMCCSASAGPAFEGGGTKSGMRATRGAIQKLRIAGDEVFYETVGGAPPRGICGSGLIDTIAELFRNRIIDPNGKLIRESKNNRVRIVDDVPEFVLAFAEHTGADKDVVITESDISSLIKSKGAVMAAMQVLLKSVGLTVKDLDRIFVAGGFGNYLDLRNAVTIGLLPDIPLHRVRFIGNSSLSGARMTLLSGHAMQQARRLARHMTYLELSVDSTFMDAFVAALFLPHTDLSLFPSVANEMSGERET